MIIEYEYTMTVADLLRQHERKHGSVEALRRRVARGKPTFAQRADLDEWRHYLRRDPTERVRIRLTGIFRDPREFFRFLSPERVRLLDELRSGREHQSLHELAEALGRDPKNVHGDVKALEAKGLVRVERRNARRSIPRARVDRIVITM